MTNYGKITLVFTGVFLAVLLVLVFILADQGRHTYAQNIAIKACLWVIYTSLEMKYGFGINHYIRVFVMLVIINDSLIGLYFDLYTTSTVFDKIQHVLGSYAFSLFAYTLLCKLTQPVLSRICSFVLVVSLGLGIGVFYEIGEFIGDLVTKPSIPSQPSLTDTNLDLIADVIGSLLGAVHATVVTSFSCGSVKK
ncbi:hypothetical protein SRRS_20100 [Sporomusa rhizae]|uniref:hypothetical protein n=1 Tax=Sporomusa rhizae TaxID=357999 RepID=UPI00352A9B32